MGKYKVSILVLMLAVVMVLVGCDGVENTALGTDVQKQLVEKGQELGDVEVGEMLDELTEELESELEDLEAIGDLIDEDGNVKASVTEEEKKEIEEALGVKLDDVGSKKVKEVLAERKAEVKKKKKVASSKGTTTNKGGSKATKSSGKGTSPSSNSSSGGNKSKSTGSSSSGKSNKGTSGNNSSSSSNSSTTGSGTTSTSTKPEPVKTTDTYTEKKDIPQGNPVEKEESTINEGESKTVSGEKGYKERTCTQTLLDGKPSGKPDCGKWVTKKEPKNPVKLVGTKPVIRFDSNKETQVRSVMNQERSSRNISALSWDGNLASQARGWAENMARNGYRHSEINYMEIIAMNTTSANDVVRYGWMTSNEGHAAAIVDGEFTHVGVGYAERNGTGYWVALFR